MGRLDAAHVDLHRDPVDQRSPDSRLILSDLRKRASAFPLRIAEVAAWARIGRSDEQKPRRERDRPVGARENDATRLERLTQALQDRGFELGELVEKKHAVMRQRDLPGRMGLPPPTSPAVVAEW